MTVPNLVDVTGPTSVGQAACRLEASRLQQRQNGTASAAFVWSCAVRQDRLTDSSTSPKSGEAEVLGTVSHRQAAVVIMECLVSFCVLSWGLESIKAQTWA